MSSFPNPLQAADEAASVAHDFIHGRNGVTREQASEAVWTIHNVLRPRLASQETLFAPPDAVTSLRPKPGWPRHSGDRDDLGTGPAIQPDELDESIIDETFVRCWTCNGSGLDGECECGGTGFDWGYTDEVRALLSKLVKEAESDG